MEGGELSTTWNFISIQQCNSPYISWEQGCKGSDWMGSKDSTPAHKSPEMTEAAAV